MEKREVDIVVISDVHLGTYGCHAKELLEYLRSISPGMLILNGDIIDGWAFSKRYFPKQHIEIIKHVFGLIANGIPVYYLPGNHDEVMRKFKGVHIGSLQIENKLSLTLGGKNIWVFHGDVFDVAMKQSKWLAKLGGKGYDLLILLNRFVNYLYVRMGKERVSFSKKIKNSVKGAIKYISNFEETICDIALENNHSYVICGHIHQPCIKTIETQNGAVTYLNSGDWIENLTALEYRNEQWKVYRYQEEPDQITASAEIESKEELFESIFLQTLPA